MKFALFAFNGDPVCFIHTVLNAQDLHAKGHDVKVIIEGAATALLKAFRDETAPLFKPCQSLISSGLIDCVCRACASKMGTLEDAEALGLPLKGEMSGHPSFSGYIEDGYTILTL